jgi:hypothetical protein
MIVQFRIWDDVGHVRECVWCVDMTVDVHRDGVRECCVGWVSVGQKCVLFVAVSAFRAGARALAWQRG